MQVKSSNSSVVGVVENVFDYTIKAISFPQKLIDTHLLIPLAKQTNKATQEIADSVFKLSGDISNASTAPNGNIKVFTILPRAAELAIGSIAFRREWFREAYSVVISKHSDLIEKKFGLEEGSLSPIAEIGKAISAHPRKGLQKKFSDNIVEKFVNHYLNDSALNTLDKISEKYELIDELKAQGKELSKRLEDKSTQFKVYEFMNDNTIALKGLITTASGILYALGGTTPAEILRGSLVTLGGTQLSLLKPGGKRIENPINIEVKSSGSEAVPFLRRLDPKVLGHHLLEHLLTQKSMGLCFNMLNTCNLFDVCLTAYGAATGNHDHDMAEVIGKSMSYILFGVANNLKPLMQQRNNEYKRQLNEQGPQNER